MFTKLPNYQASPCRIFVGDHFDPYTVYPKGKVKMVSNILFMDGKPQTSCNISRKIIEHPLVHVNYRRVDHPQTPRKGLFPSHICEPRLRPTEYVFPPYHQAYAGLVCCLRVASHGFWSRWWLVLGSMGYLPV